MIASGSKPAWSSTASCSNTFEIIDTPDARARRRHQPSGQRKPTNGSAKPDDLERALGSIDEIDDPVRAAGTLAFRVARAQGFAEGNKRTGLLLAR